MNQKGKSVLDLGKNVGLGGFVFDDDVDSSDSFSIKAQVLGEGLGDHELVAVIQEDFDWLGVFHEVTSGVALVGSVENGENSLFKEKLGKGSPLFWGQIDSSWVVGTGVEEDGGSWGCFEDVVGEHLEVNALGLGVPVAVVIALETDSLDDGGVV